MRRFVAVVTIVCSTAACTFSKMTAINSEPSGARVRISGQDRGVTPLTTSLGCSGVTSSGKEIELSKENYRTLKTNMEYKTLTKNIVWGILFFWPSIFIWGKCPEDSYTFRLDQAVAELGESSTLTVVQLEAPFDVYVGDQKIVAKNRMVLQPGWHTLRADVNGRRVPAGEVLLEARTDHVVSFGASAKAR